MKAYKDTCLRDTSWTAGTETPTPRCAQLGQCHRPNSYKSRETPGEPWSIEDDPEKRSAKEGTHQLCWGWRGGGGRDGTHDSSLEMFSACHWHVSRQGKPDGAASGYVTATPEENPLARILLAAFQLFCDCPRFPLGGYYSSLSFEQILNARACVSHKHLRFTHTTSHPKPQLQLPNSRTGWLTLPVWPYRLFNPWWLVGWPQ